jgi:DNA-directed RNA polymerase specialized sigma24 family protein
VTKTGDEMRPWEEARDRLAVASGASPTELAAALAACMVEGMPVAEAEDALGIALRAQAQGRVRLGEAIARAYVDGRAVAAQR